MTPEGELRMFLGERIPPGGDESDTLFTNLELLYLLEITNGAIHAAAAHGWAIKAAEYVDLIDMVEEGSERRLSQRYKHARLQAQYYSELAQLDSEKLLQSARSAVRGRAAAWGIPASSETPSGRRRATEESPFVGPEKTYTRPFPLHRFYPIKN